MLRLMLPVTIILVAAAGGGTAGYLLRPAELESHPPDESTGAAEGEKDTHAAEAMSGTAVAHPVNAGDGGEGADAPEHDYVKLNNQFVIPVVEHGRVAALVILSLSVEVPPGGGDAVFAAEPKLRDAFLRVLFDHANSGGFAGSFTESAALAPLRNALLEAGQSVLGDRLDAVLIGDIVRQDN